MMKMESIPDDYKISDTGKEIISAAIQQIKNSLDSFQFAIQDRVTPVTAGALNRVDFGIRYIREVLDNEQHLATLHYSLCEREEGVVK